MNHILIVDDEEEIRELIQYNLMKNDFEVSTAENGVEALRLLENGQFDLVLLDVMMPGTDGIEVCRQIRLLPHHKNTIICFLTARHEDYSQIAGFEAGADDYIAKPVKPRVLVSKIKALLRRYDSPNDNVENISGVELDREKHLVKINGENVHLPKKEFELLALLISKPENVFERNVILETVWGSDIIVGDRTIDVHIRKLREKIGSNFIKTIKGVGYKFTNSQD